MTVRHRDAVGVAAIGLAAIVVTSPLLVHRRALPPDGYALAFDMLNHDGTAAAAWTTVTRFRQFPLRSPWHGGGYPLYAHPEDHTLSPTMLLVLAAGPYAALKIEFVLLTIAAGVGMFLLTRRMMGYALVAALFSATSFALGGFLMARWMRGWLATTHAVWLPLVMYALWRGRERRRWLALAAVLVAWLLVDHKYVALVMGWFLVMVGLLRLDEEQPEGVRNPDVKVPDTLIRPAWGYFGRLTAVWAFGAGLAAVKLVPMWPLLQAHLASWRPAWSHNPWHAIALWLVFFAGLGLAPVLATWVRARRTRLRGAAGIVGVLAAAVVAAIVWAPPHVLGVQPLDEWLKHVLECVVSFGGWKVNDLGVRVPWPSDEYWSRAPVGILVLLLAIVALFRRHRGTWKWAILAGLFLVIDVSRATPWDLGESVRGLPLLSWIRRTREQLNFFLFFTLTLLAGRAVHWHGRTRWRAALQPIAWGVLILNVLYLGWNVRQRLAFSVSGPVPPPVQWNETYDLLEEPGQYWRDHPCVLVGQNIGLKRCDLDLRDDRSTFLDSSLVIGPGRARWPNRAFRSMAHFRDRANRADLLTFTPNEIIIQVSAVRPGVLTINQIADRDWRVGEGALVADVPLLMVDLSRTGEYRVRLRYVPSLLYRGLAASAATAIAGGVLLVMISRRLRAGPNP